MDRELLDNQRVHERDERIVEEDDRFVCQEQKERDQTLRKAEEEESETRGNLVYVLWRTVDHFFPHMNTWLSQIDDKRDKELITYTSTTLLWTGLLLFITKCGSLKQMRDRMRTTLCCNVVKELSGQDDLMFVPHDNTLTYLFTRIDPRQCEYLLSQMMKSLFRKKVFERYKMLGQYYAIAIDGVYTHTFSYAHCPKCLVREHANGTTTWQHAKLQASFVTLDGFCLPIASEWIENGDGASKQDCEKKALYRLITKIRILYPKLPMCILLDALYGGEPIFQALESARMEWMIVFKRGVMPEVYDWLHNWMKKYGAEQYNKKEEQTIKCKNKRTHAERLIRYKAQHKTRTISNEQINGWKIDMPHWNNERVYTILKSKVVVEKKVHSDYTWLLSKGISSRLNKNTVMEIAQYGRCRWKIENEGNNTQKNGGYNLKHCYARDVVAMKVYHTLLDIAHIINQLIERGTLIVAAVYGSLRAIARVLLEHMRYVPFVKPKNPKRIQIRLLWDTS